MAARKSTVNRRSNAKEKAAKKISAHRREKQRSYERKRAGSRIRVCKKLWDKTMDSLHTRPLIQICKGGVADAEAEISRLQQAKDMAEEKLKLLQGECEQLKEALARSEARLSWRENVRDWVSSGAQSLLWEFQTLGMQDLPVGAVAWPILELILGISAAFSHRQSCSKTRCGPKLRLEPLPCGVFLKPATNEVFTVSFLLFAEMSVQSWELGIERVLEIFTSAFQQVLRCPEASKLHSAAWPDDSKHRLPTEIPSISRIEHATLS